MRISLRPLALVLVFCFAFLPQLSGAEGEAAAPEPVTTADPEIPTEELALLLTPLPKAQLLIEAEGWQALAQQRAEEVADAELEIRRLGDDADSEADSAGVDAAVSGVKGAMQTGVVELREERTQALDGLIAVVKALEAKTSPDDADTQAIIRDYRLYAGAVSGIRIDLEDPATTWLAIQGWIFSEEGGLRWALNLAKFFGILIVAWFISGIFQRTIHRALKKVPGTSALLEDFLVRFSRWVVMVIGILMALSALEVSVGPMLAAVGALGFILAFALQDSLGNFASGIMILLFRPFDIGDVVDAGGVSGTVGSMNLVSTTVKTFDNKQMIVPNSRIWGDVITNASGASERRVDMEFGIGYDDDMDRAQAILEEIVAAHPKALKDPAPTIKLSALADSSVNFIVRPWAKTADYWAVFWDITREVKRRFDAEGIGIPYPQQDVHLHIAGEAGALALPTAGSKAQPTSTQTRDGGLDDAAEDAEREG
jgi:small conductance mechanosensitive channel